MQEVKELIKEKMQEQVKEPTNEKNTQGKAEKNKVKTEKKVKAEKNKVNENIQEKEKLKEKFMQLLKVENKNDVQVFSSDDLKNINIKKVLESISDIKDIEKIKKIKNIKDIHNIKCNKCGGKCQLKKTKQPEELKDKNKEAGEDTDDEDTEDTFDICEIGLTSDNSMWHIYLQYKLDDEYNKWKYDVLSINIEFNDRIKYNRLDVVAYLPLKPNPNLVLKKYEKESFVNRLTINFSVATDDPDGLRISFIFLRLLKLLNDKKIIENNKDQMYDEYKLDIAFKNTLYTIVSGNWYVQMNFLPDTIPSHLKETPQEVIKKIIK